MPVRRPGSRSWTSAGRLSPGGIQPWARSVTSNVLPSSRTPTAQRRPGSWRATNLSRRSSRSRSDSAGSVGLADAAGSGCRDFGRVEQRWRLDRGRRRRGWRRFDRRLRQRRNFLQQRRKLLEHLGVVGVERVLGRRQLGFRQLGLGDRGLYSFWFWLGGSGSVPVLRLRLGLRQCVRRSVSGGFPVGRSSRLVRGDRKAPTAGRVLLAVGVVPRRSPGLRARVPAPRVSRWSASGPAAERV